MERPDEPFEIELRQRQVLGEAAARNAEGIQNSAFFLAIFSGNYATDAVCLLQLALAIVMDKPIVLIVPLGIPIPAKLRQIADAIEEVDMEEPKAVEALLHRLGARLREG